MPQNVLTTPRLTVITVCYNAAAIITKTLESVIDQSYPNIEYIIIDGGSTDGTLNIIKKYQHDISFFMSEPDKGIYDAMNKAIDRATGEWINFINAGDYYFHSNTIAEVFSREIEDTIDFIYGDHIWKGDNEEVRVAVRPLDLMWQRISFSHQSLITRTKLMKEKKFDLSYDIVSDYNFYFLCYMQGNKFLKHDLPISVFLAGGISDVHFLKRTYERWKVVKKYKNEMNVHSYYLKLILSHYKRKLLCKLYHRR